MSVEILTDSTSYLSEKIRKELNIRMVSLSLSFDSHGMKETEIDNEEFFEIMKKRGIPTSSQPSLGEIHDEMADAVNKGNSLCGIFLSSEMSGTFSTSELARKMVLEKQPDAAIELVDSRSNSMQLGFAVLAAARAALEGKSLQEVKQAALENVQCSRFLFIPHNMEYLKKGGRIGGASALLGDIFKIIPILTVENGKTAVYKKVRTKKNAILAMIEKMLHDIQQHGLGEIVVHHINCLPEAKEVAGWIKEKIAATIEIVDIGPVIGLHVGPGTIGIAYYTLNPLR